MEKQEFFIEWWTLGNEETNIESATFHICIKHLKQFLELFQHGHKRSILFLKRCDDNKVLIEKRSRY